MSFLTKVILASQILALTCFISSPASAQGRGPSTKEERAKVLKLALESEKDVFNASFQSDRAWFMQWIAEIPDISLELGKVGLWCMDAFPEKPEEQRPYILYQFMTSSVAFIIENPTKAKSPELIDKAGLEGVLRAYEAYLLRHPEAHNARLDDALKLRNKGELLSLVNSLRASQ